MNWEQTIRLIRSDSNYKDLVEKAYFDENLVLNVERYRSSPEYKEILIYIKKFSSGGRALLDLGSGNGISAIAFALDGFNVKCIEPDPSETIGSGAIKKLKDYYSLINIEIYESFAENIKFDDASFDIVFARQCMHHAHNLNKFVSESARVLKPGGMFFTVRDHIILNPDDKEWFLSSHPLHRFYGGENAFKEDEYYQLLSYVNRREKSL